MRQNGIAQAFEEKRLAEKPYLTRDKPLAKGFSPRFKAIYNGQVLMCELKKDSKGRFLAMLPWGQVINIEKVRPVPEPKKAPFEVK